MRLRSKLDVRSTKLKRALRADIDEAAWSTLYSTTSHPFAKPESGKIAVKVINHYAYAQFPSRRTSRSSSRVDIYDPTTARPAAP